MKLAFISILGLFIGSYSLGDAITPSTYLDNRGVPPPCKGIEHACHRVAIGAHEEPTTNAIIDNCMVPILNGKTVKGVRVSKAVVKTCKDFVDIEVEHANTHEHPTTH